MKEDCQGIRTTASHSFSVLIDCRHDRLNVPLAPTLVRFGADLPAMRYWVPRHFDFAGYIIGEHPRSFGNREERAAGLSVRGLCLVGGSGVGTHLIKRVLESYPMARARLPELRIIC